MDLWLKRDHVHLLKEEVERMRPIEACAMLFGEVDQKKSVVKKVVITPNKLESAVRFKIDPEMLFNAFRKAQEEGLEFIGFFHSHSASVKPSSIDLKYMELWEDTVWLISSMTKGNLAAYLMKKGKVKKVKIGKIT